LTVSTVPASNNNSTLIIVVVAVVLLLALAGWMFTRRKSQA
jgi:LPXTG-motif cell wall-anchored protein